MSARSRAGAVIAIALGLTLALAACGLPKDSAPRPIANDKVPFSLLGPTSTKPGDQSDTSGTIIDVWFVAGERITSVSRILPNPTPKSVLESLVKGVADGDPPGLSSAIPQNTKIVSADMEGASVVVTLSNEILSVTGPEQKNAFAQLVYTTTGLPGVSGVRFRALDTNGNAQDLEPPTDNALKQGPLTRGDFSSLAPAK